MNERGCHHVIDHAITGCTLAYAKFEFRLLSHLPDANLCYKICQDLAWAVFSHHTANSCTNKTNGHDFTELMMKVTLHFRNNRNNNE